MEPLSLIANIIPIVDAARSAARTLEKLTSLRHAPQQVLQLLNEVSDFRTVLTMVQEVAEKLKTHEQHLDIEQHLTGLISKADEVLRQINVNSRSRTGSTEPETLTWARWIRNCNGLEELSRKMRDIRIKITSVLTLLNAAEIHQLRVSLSDISLTYNQLNNNIELSEAAITNLQSTLDTVQSSLQIIQSSVGQYLGNDAPPNQTAAPTIRIQTSVQRSCSGLCQCCCHRPTTFSSPAWLRGLIGLLFIGYTGSPVLNRNPQRCSERLCLRSSHSRLKVHYYFPPWFLSRMVELRDRWTPTDSHMLTVRTPRVVSNMLLWFVIQSGNLAQLQVLFAEGKASPFDVDHLGISALIFAVRHRRVEICEFLLAEYADPEHEDMSSRSAIDWALLNALTYVSNNHSETIYRLFERYVDPIETLRKRQFTILHQIVLGLSRLDLRSQLDITTSEIDVRDSVGRTPLHWAVEKFNIPAIEVLLEYGARIDILAEQGFSTFHLLRARNDDTARLALLLGAFSSSEGGFRGPIRPCRVLGSEEGCLTECVTCDIDAIRKLINHRHEEGYTALSYAAFYHQYNHARLLLAHGALVDLGVPLFHAIQENCHRMQELFFQSGVRTDIKDVEKQNILHFAACCGDLKSISILIKSKIAVDGYNHRDIHEHTPLECFDISRSEYREESESERLKCREAFLRLLEGCATGWKNVDATV